MSYDRRIFITSKVCNGFYEPLAILLMQILKDQNQIRHSQVKVIEALILHMMGTDPYKIDISSLKEILDNQ